MTRPDSTLITMILDRSGSMGDVRESTIDGFNEFLKGQKTLPGEAKLSLIQFDHEYEVNYLARDIKYVSRLNLDTYEPRGSTALLDAIGRTIEETGKALAAMDEEKRPSKVIVVITTDGHENASQTFTRPKVMEMIKEQKDKYQWEFIYLGANQDAIQAGASLGIGMQNAMNYQSTEKGATIMYASLSASIGRARGGGTLDFLEDERLANSSS